MPGNPYAHLVQKTKPTFCGSRRNIHWLIQLKVNQLKLDIENLIPSVVEPLYFRQDSMGLPIAYHYARWPRRFPLNVASSYCRNDTRAPRLRIPRNISWISLLSPFIHRCCCCTHPSINVAVASTKHANTNKVSCHLFSRVYPITLFIVIDIAGSLALFFIEDRELSWCYFGGNQCRGALFEGVRMARTILEFKLWGNNHECNWMDLVGEEIENSLIYYVRYGNKGDIYRYMRTTATFMDKWGEQWYTTIDGDISDICAWMRTTVTSM